MSENKIAPLREATERGQEQDKRDYRQFTTLHPIRKRPTPVELDAGLTRALDLAQRRPWPPLSEEPRLQRDRGLTSWSLRPLGGVA